jgi:hypothetical protein
MKDLEGSVGGLRHYPGICIEGLRETTKSNRIVVVLKGDEVTGG